LFDVKNLNQGPKWTLKAHEKACTGLAVTPSLPGLLISTSLENSLKIWDVSRNKPSLITNRVDQFGPGALFGVSISEATPYVCAIASEGMDLQLFDFKSAIKDSSFGGK
jgi:periodic tryptophan protein 1